MCKNATSEEAPAIIPPCLTKKHTHTHSLHFVCACTPLSHQNTHTHTWGHTFTTMSASLRASFAVPVPCARTRLQRRPLHSFPPASPINIHTLIHCTFCVPAGLFCSVRPMCKNATSEEAPAIIPPCLTKKHTHTRSLLFVSACTPLPHQNTHTLGDTCSLLCLRACRPLSQCPSHVQERDFRGGPCIHSPLPHRKTYTHMETHFHYYLYVLAPCFPSCLTKTNTHAHTHTHLGTHVHYYVCVLALPCHTKTHTHTHTHTHTWGHTFTTMFACLQASFAVPVPCARTRLQRRPLPSFPPASPIDIHTLIHCTFCVLAGLFCSVRPMCKNATSEEAPAFIPPCHTEKHIHTRSLLFVCACTPLPHQNTHTHTRGHTFTTMFACLQASFAVPVPCARTRLQRRPLPSW